MISAFSLNVLDLFDQPETETWTFSKKNSFTCTAYGIYKSRYSGYIIAWWLKVNRLHVVDLQPRNSRTLSLKSGPKERYKAYFGSIFEFCRYKN